MQKSDEVEKVSLHKLLKKYPIKTELKFSYHNDIWNKGGMSKYPPLHTILANLSRIEIKENPMKNNDQRPNAKDAIMYARSKFK
jgi:hypothetical protein